MSEHLYTYADPPNERHLTQIVDALQDDGVVALGTGTNWAFVGSPLSKKAEKRIRLLKPDHPKDRPFALLCSDIAMATSMTYIDGSAYRLLKRIWPGPYTVLLKSNHDLPRLLKTKRAVVGVRIPSDALTRLIIEKFGGPLMASTVPDGPQGPLTMGFEVQERFGHGIDIVVDVGDPLPGTETTVLSWTDGELEVVREGAGDVSGL
jgi:tRNA threonylcarbamoyl adenosine modification protein (Sua5/YciO/YrdC/YwlC family)